MIRRNGDGADGTWILNGAQNGNEQKWIPTFLMCFCNRDQQPTEGDLSHNTIGSIWHAEPHSRAETKVRDESHMGMKKGLGTFWCCASQLRNHSSGKVAAALI